MKKFFKMFGAAGLLAGMLMVGGCGSSDDSATPQGRVVKAPVAGATVTYSDGTSTTTDSNGYYAYKGLAVTTAGGTYPDMNGVSRPAPNMATPAGKTNVTPLSTLFVNASPADQAKITALLGTASIDTVVVGTISGASNVLVAKLNETLGEVLTQVKEGNATPSAAFIAGMAAQVATLTPATAATTTGLLDALKANVVEAPVTIDETKVIAIADKTIEGAVVPANTGSTGGTTIK